MCEGCVCGGRVYRSKDIMEENLYFVHKTRSYMCREKQRIFRDFKS